VKERQMAARNGIKMPIVKINVGAKTK
jgi:hypothetical protein